LLLEYLVADDRLIVFAATSAGVTAYEVDESAQGLASRVQLARDLLQRRGGEAEARGVLGALYDIVMGPVARAGLLKPGASLIIVPHHVLTYIPFAALVNPATARYVAQDHVILNVPTSAVLPVLRGIAAANDRRRPRAEVFAPLQQELPGTISEAQSVGRAMRGTITRTGRTATEARLRTALTTGGIVHVASHARLNTRNPLFSYVELAPGLRGEADNGRLEVHELLGGGLNAALVFLSGCETAVGRSWATQFDTGEDYATLGQAFLMAGARNVVATLWRIDDEGAAEFARQYYGALQGNNYAEAIALAQRLMLRDVRYRSPYFWAAYQVMGGGGANRVVVSDKR
jgi:CHAT domain-containing protein